jgi:hypothetical protein
LRSARTEAPSARTASRIVMRFIIHWFELLGAEHLNCNMAIKTSGDL